MRGRSNGPLTHCSDRPNTDTLPQNSLLRDPINDSRQLGVGEDNCLMAAIHSANRITTRGPENHGTNLGIFG